MTISPRNDVVLVVLPDTEAERTTAAGLFTAHAITPAATYGRVYKVGPKVREVAPGDIVAFPKTVGDLWPVGEHQCLFVREPEIVARIPKGETR